MKKLLLFFVIPFMFFSCNKCKECTDGDPWSRGGSGDGEYETFGDEITEVCSDNFESKKDFNNFIETMEDNGYDCKSDFWN